MCDYSLHSVKSRPAKVGDKLTTRDFGTGTRGFAASENPSVAVCVLPGTELAFAHEVKRLSARVWPWHDCTIEHKTAIFRQINKDKVTTHHDALEFPDGQIVLLTWLTEVNKPRFSSCQRSQGLRLRLKPNAESHLWVDCLSQHSTLWPARRWVATHRKTVDCNAA